MAITHVTPENFNDIINQPNKTILVDFFADWCGPCKKLAPILEEMAETLPENQVIAKLNTDECKEISKQFKVMSIPTMIIFKDGKEVSRTVGFRSQDEVLELFK